VYIMYTYIFCSWPFASAPLPQLQNGSSAHVHGCVFDAAGDIVADGETGVCKGQDAPT